MLWTILVHAAGRGSDSLCLSGLEQKSLRKGCESHETAPSAIDTHLSQGTNSVPVTNRIRDPNSLPHLHPSENSPELCSLVIWVSGLLCGGYICIDCKYSLMYLIPILSIFLFHYCLSSGLRPSLTFSVYLPSPALHINGHLISDFGHDGIIKSFCIGNYTCLDSTAGLV